MPNVNFRRAEYAHALPTWTTISDCIKGQRAIKAKGDDYLPRPETSKGSNSESSARFKRYLERAVFYPVTQRTVEGLTSEVFSEPPVLELPKTGEIMREDIDGAGTTFEQQSKKVLQEVISIGRAGLLSDFPTIEGDQPTTLAQLQSGEIRPRIIYYTADQIINWRETAIGGAVKLSLLVLLESTEEPTDDEFEVETAPRWRVYRRTDEGVTVEVWKEESSASAQGLPADMATTYVLEMEPVVIRSSSGPLVEIPFEFVGALNNDSTPDNPPASGLADMNVAHYRNSADYEHSVFLVGQPTPVFSGLDTNWAKEFISGKVALGSENAVALPKDGKASLLQAAPNSMPIEAMQHKEDQMKAIGARLLEPGGAAKGTATEAMIEKSSDTSILASASRNVASAYKHAFENALQFLGITDEVVVELNDEFAAMSLNYQERQEVVAAWQSGVLSFEEVRQVYEKRGLTKHEAGDARDIIAAGTLPTF